MKRMTVCLLTLLSLWAAAPAASLADERILDYQSDVTIHTGGAMTVTETIRVRAEGHNIRRGIYRDFPTRYRDRFGNRYRVDFSVEGVQRDGQPEPWHTEKRSNGIRLYIGSANQMLSPGVYSYRIRYHTSRQLGFFAEHDELWWNVTGNGWGFPIDAARARINLPGAVPASELKPAGWVGAYGSTDTSVRHSVVDGRSVEYASARPLAPGEGLTVLLQWPKGLIAEPGPAQQARWFVRDNGAALVLLLGLLLPAGWYLWAWNQVGRDPRKGVIIPLFQPPPGLSPAATRYVLDMAFNRNAFTAAIISLAVKGHLQIEEKTKRFSLKDSEYTLRRLTPDNPAPLSKGEQGVLHALLPRANSSISLKNENHSEFQTARSALKAALKREYRGRLFQLNSLYLAPPMVLSVLAAVVALAFHGGPAVWIPYVILTVLLHVIFIWLMRAPTPAGRRVMDEIEGFKMYLGTAERDRLEQMRSPTLTPEVFEQFLPYAYALGVENSWCERFANELPEDLQRQAGYQPNWYSGNFRADQALSRLGDDLGSSLSSAISSASSPPGSSSGGGGGGFSGGGGGGGGGGGW